MASKPKTVDAYLAAQSEPARTRLAELLDCLRASAPDASETIKWGQPALSYDRILFMVGAYQKHVSLYPTPRAIEACRDVLRDHETTRATIHFPLDRPVPAEIVRQVADFRVRDCLENDAKWM